MSKLRSVMIVGGGTAGWLTASVLNASLNGEKERVKISVVESPGLTRIGVGEATIPSIRRTLNHLGVREVEFLKETEATFKNGIKFENWLFEGHEFFHPFHKASLGHPDTSGQIWVETGEENRFDYCVSPQPFLAEAGFSPKSSDRFYDYGGEFTYAYHFDAIKFADFLTGFSVSRGVNHILDDVVGASFTESGDLETIATKRHGNLKADLFIDCTGFSRTLIAGQMKECFESFSNWLLCDGAIAAQVSYEAGTKPGIKPYTTSSAFNNGWCWDIGLRQRRGSGYVYSSQFSTKDEAEREFRVRKKIPDDIEVRCLKFESGKLRRMWVKNCVSIGLSSGFLEPLESTGIALVEQAAFLLCELFPWTGNCEQPSLIYNQKMSEIYLECRDFINLHYCLSKRDDTEFWRAVGNYNVVTPALKDLFGRWEQKLPSPVDFGGRYHIFPASSYEYILYGMKWRPIHYSLPPSSKENFDFTEVIKATRLLTNKLLPHEEALTKLVSRSFPNEVL